MYTDEKWMGLDPVCFSIRVFRIRFFSTADVDAADGTESAYAAGEVVVQFQPGVKMSQKAMLHQEQNARVLSRNPQLGFEVVRVTDRSVSEAVRQYRQHPMVENVEPNDRFHAEGTPNDSLFSDQWNLERVKAPSAWNVTRGQGTRIAIVDTGVELNHPDLAGKIAPGYDFVEDDTTPEDGNGHGTHMAGIAAAVTDNGIGIASMAPDAELIPVRVLDDNGSGTLSDVASGITYAADQGADVINLSLGSSQSSSILEDAVNYAWNRESVIVAAAGGSGSTTPQYPASYTNAIAVAATDRNDRVPNFSTRGDWVDAGAPGVDIPSTYIGGGYQSLSGSSTSAAHVSGLAALLASQGRNPSNILTAVEETGDPIPDQTFKRINAYRAVMHEGGQLGRKMLNVHSNR
ncbi:S8 family peptidase [Paludifilum halophilum]|uniref:Uncharacterized protein n=1 Tax=Paludifilum halophilum TaxID=1642702 RepID=A0A235B4N9_9BACL|nr:S8 family peptidase [Paludifilum halophilum]OYD07270.1 hypothetical protein CHM34_12890 [Paludifilum halophilum]